MTFDPFDLAEFLGIEPDARDTLFEGSEHPYECRCDVCREWWQLMGEDENGDFGPFGQSLDLDLDNSHSM